jgi:hypothetical protein
LMAWFCHQKHAFLPPLFAAASLFIT